LLSFDHPYPSGEILYEEAIGIYRKLHPNVPFGVSPRYKACGSLDALGPNRHDAAGTPAAYLDRNLNHSGSPLFLFSLARIIDADAETGIGQKNGRRGDFRRSRDLGLKSEAKEPPGAKEGDWDCPT